MSNGDDVGALLLWIAPRLCQHLAHRVTDRVPVPDADAVGLANVDGDAASPRLADAVTQCA